MPATVSIVTAEKVAPAMLYCDICQNESEKVVELIDVCESYVVWICASCLPGLVTRMEAESA